MATKVSVQQVKKTNTREVKMLSAKDEIAKIIQEQPDDSSYDEILRELAFARMIERGLLDSRHNRTISNDEMARRINDEKQLAKSLEDEEWISDLTQKDKNKYREYVRHSLNKQKRINIRMSERDLKKIRAKAIEEGIPYQSLISMLIHKYNEGKVSITR